MQYGQHATEPQSAIIANQPVLLAETVQKKALVQEWCGGDIYEYYPLGEYVVMAPGICGGRPTFKYTRIEVIGVLNLIAAGYAVMQIAQRFEVPHQAIEEALRIVAIHLGDWKIAA